MSQRGPLTRLPLLKAATYTHTPFTHTHTHALIYYMFIESCLTLIKFGHRITRACSCALIFKLGKRMTENKGSHDSQALARSN